MNQFVNSSNSLHDVISSLTPCEATKRPFHSNSMGGHCHEFLVFPYLLLTAKQFTFLLLLFVYSILLNVYSVYLGEREGCGGWPPDATCLNNWCLQLFFFLQRSVLIWIKLKITYVIKCEELRIVAANLARYRPNWIFDVFISMKSVKLLLFSFIEWISNLLFFCVI